MKTLLLSLIGFATAALACAESFSASEKFNHSCPVSAQAEFSLTNVNGSVEITAWDKNEVSIEAEKKAGSTEDLQKIQITVGASASRVTVTTQYERTGWFGRTVRGAVHYKVYVPASIHVQKIDVVNSNITINGVTGDVEAVSVNGSIRASGLANTARLKTVNGNITASFDSIAPGQTVLAKTVNGSCKLTLPADLSADLDASTVNGRISCDIPVNSIKTTRTKLQGHTGQGEGAAIEARSVNGNISFERQS